MNTDIDPFVLKTISSIIQVVLVYFGYMMANKIKICFLPENREPSIIALIAVIVFFINYINYITKY